GDDGRILLHCFSGCSAADVCRALGLDLKHLFSDRPQSGGERPSPRRSRPRDGHTDAFQLNMLALDFPMRAERVLRSAVNLSIQEWTPLELNRALKAVGQAYADLEQAADIERQADEACEMRQQQRKAG